MLVFDSISLLNPYDEFGNPSNPPAVIQWELFPYDFSALESLSHKDLTLSQELPAPIDQGASAISGRSGVTGVNSGCGMDIVSMPVAPKKIS